MPRALVIGGTGFVGRGLIAKLAAAGWSVAELRFADRAARPPVPGVELLTAESGQAPAIAAVLAGAAPFEAVFHVAAGGVEPGDRDPARLLAANLLLPHAVLEALSARPPGRFIYAGSCAEYAPAPAGTLITEDHPVGGPDLYGASKATGTLWVHALAAHYGIRCAVLRLFHIYGPGEAPHRLVSSLVRQLSAGEPVALSAGEQMRDLLYRDDVAAGLLAAVDATLPATGGAIWNLCSSEPVAIRQVALTAAEVWQRPAEALRFGALAYRPHELMWLAGDNRRFRAASGWQPRWTLRAALEDMRQRPPSA